MIRLVNNLSAKAVDDYSINKMGIPSVVLMERAAMAVADRITDAAARVLVVAGTGNNGADALAVARLLALRGVYVDICYADAVAAGSSEYQLQKGIVNNLVRVNEYINNTRLAMTNYDYIIDGIFGVGINRPVDGVNAELIREINNSGAYVIAIDIPSGINGSNGAVYGVAVKADETVTMGLRKIGISIEPGKSYAGKVYVADVGWVTDGADGANVWGYNQVFSMEPDDIDRIPDRRDDVDKGKCGKVLIIAGSDSMSGAAVLSSLGALRTGCGLVKVYTHKDNKETLIKNVVEAVPVVYDEDVSQLPKLCEWADIIIAGPGMSTNDTAKEIMNIVLEYINSCDLVAAGKYVVLDADALNLLAMLRADRNPLYRLNENVVLTPHVGEASRLIRASVEDIKNNPLNWTSSIAKEYNCVCVMKDSATVISDSRACIVNTSGNGGMATAGSGDVLTGVIAGCLSAYMGYSGQIDRYVNNNVYIAALAVYAHGRAGDLAASYKGKLGMIASDIANLLPEVFC